MDPWNINVHFVDDYSDSVADYSETVTSGHAVDDQRFYDCHKTGLPVLHSGTTDATLMIVDSTLTIRTNSDMRTAPQPHTAHIGYVSCYCSTCALITDMNEWTDCIMGILFTFVFRGSIVGLRSSQPV